MFHLVRPQHATLAARLIVPLRTFFGWLTKYNRKLIYPPSPSQITTQNRLFPTYFEHPTELGTVVLTKDPLLLNFTIPGDARCNEVTQALFDLLSDASRCPLKPTQPVALASIACDSPGGRELQQTYAVGKIPSIVVLKKQMVLDRFVPSSLARVGDELEQFIESIYH